MFWHSRQAKATAALPPAPQYKFHRIRVLPDDAPNLRRYAVSRPTGRMANDDRIWKSNCEDWLEHLKSKRDFTDETMEAVRKLYQLEGVFDVFVDDGELLVKLGAAYDFEDFHREILSAIRSAFFKGDDFDKVEVFDLKTEPSARTDSSAANRR